jgi:hypothetical protein
VSILFIILFGGYIFGMLVVSRAVTNSDRYQNSINVQLIHHSVWLVVFIAGLYWLFQWWVVFAN